MTHASPAARIVDCDDAPVSSYESEAAARVAAIAGPRRWDEREIARSALGDLPEEGRAAFLADMLCDLRGPGARRALVLVRNRITRHLHDLIAEEYDAEVARMGRQDMAELARCDRISAASRSSSSVIPSLHQVVGASNGRGRPDLNQVQSTGQDGDCLRAPAATVELREPASPRFLPIRAGWQRLKSAAAWLDDSWVGDLIGAVCLFGSIYIFTIIAWALS